MFFQSIKFIGKYEMLFGLINFFLLKRFIYDCEYGKKNYFKFLLIKM